ncbi:hypothetical protein T4C_450 [Trichinella pseudospiralis]|uniref:Uncharacterized protein n=1 Tax=Trichinella pseudospiralis TaxID=6337 RepID=A0A0V1GS69_TRIPS|nr:hypothetical protein T4C_450 [Trichinella pseudospiralis]
MPYAPENCVRVSSTLLWKHYRSATTTFNGMVHPSLELQQLGSVFA